MFVLTEGKRLIGIYKQMKVAVFKRRKQVDPNVVIVVVVAVTEGSQPSSKGRSVSKGSHSHGRQRHPSRNRDETEESHLHSGIPASESNGSRAMVKSPVRQIHRPSG